jgi:hypothetical protein
MMHRTVAAREEERGVGIGQLALGEVRRKPLVLVG